MFCTYCGAENPNNSKFCNNCGQAISVTIISNTEATTGISMKHEPTKYEIDLAYYKADLQMQQQSLRLQDKQLREQQKQTKIQQKQLKSMAKCPRCGSTSLSGNKKGFGIGKAVVGAALIGPIGLVAGNLGAGKVTVTCLNCGKKFKA